MRHWDWRIEAYSGDKHVITTTHRGDHSRDIELEAIASLGRTAIVTPLSDVAKKQWAEGWRPPVEVAR